MSRSPGGAHHQPAVRDLDDLYRRLATHQTHLTNLILRGINAMSDAQTHLDADVAQLTQALSDFAQEWAAIGEQVKAQAPAVDFTKLDGIAAQAAQLDAAWKAQTAPPADKTVQPDAAANSVAAGTGVAAPPSTAGSGTTDGLGSAAPPTQQPGDASQTAGSPAAPPNA